MRRRLNSARFWLNSDTPSPFGRGILTRILQAAMRKHPLTSCALDQNDPNPFHFTTTFRYSLSGRSKVLLEIFDTRGKQVDVLVKGEQEAGIWSVVWTAAEDLKPGAYFCRMTATSAERPGETFVQKRKIGLLR